MRPAQLLSVVFLSIAASRASNVSINLPLGTIVGKTTVIEGKSLNVFLGVPFAEPPVGSLRYQRTKKVESYEQRIEAFDFSRSCYQIQMPVQQFLPDDNVVFETSGFSEDCLYMNIWAPSSNSSVKRSVMLWIHGGGFIFGQANYFVYHGATLASMGDVVVVSINYRLGSFGFFTTETDAEPGNLGMLDIKAALEWIQENIIYFGGDPNQVTIFGNSAGSIAISLMATSTSFEGLFHRAILESGVANTIMDTTKQRMLELSKSFAEHANCSNSSSDLLLSSEIILECLRLKSPEELAKIDAAFLKRNEGFTQFLPVYNDELFNYDSINPLRANYKGEVELLVGFSKHEMNSLMFYFFPELYDPKLSFASKANVIKLIGPFLQHTAKMPNPEKFLDYYFQEVEDGNQTQLSKAMSKIMSDLLFHCPGIMFGNKYSSENGKLYFYYFTHQSQNVYFQLLYGNWSGAFHFDEVQYVFGFPFVESNYEYTAIERQFSRNLIEVWTTFAKHGNPSTPFYPNWPLYSQENHLVYTLNANTKDLTPFPRYESCLELWKDNYFIE